MKFYFPLVSRKKYEELEARVRDIEKHFVTKRNPETGQVLETLADVPMKERAERRQKMRGMTWQQQKKYLEATDGGRLVTNA